IRPTTAVGPPRPCAVTLGWWQTHARSRRRRAAEQRGVCAARSMETCCQSQGACGPFTNRKPNDLASARVDVYLAKVARLLAHAPTGALHVGMKLRPNNRSKNQWVFEKPPDGLTLSRSSNRGPAAVRVATGSTAGGLGPPIDKYRVGIFAAGPA